MKRYCGYLTLRYRGGFLNQKRDSERRMEKITQSGNSQFLPSRNTVTLKNKFKKKIEKQEAGIKEEAMHLKLLREKYNLEYSYESLNGRIIQQYVLTQILRVEVKWNEMAENRLW